jgi:trk system potassium uptake protein TrkA
MPEENASEKALADIRRLRECLQATLFLDRLKMPELEKLMSAMKKQHVPAGLAVFRQGDKGETFYLVSQGKLSFWVRKGLVEKKVTELHPKDYFGETALISDAPRSATVKAETDCDLFLLHKADFKDILMANPWIAEEIRSHMAHRTQAKEKS